MKTFSLSVHSSSKIYHVTGAEPHLTNLWAISFMWRINYEVNEATIMWMCWLPSYVGGQGRKQTVRSLWAQAETNKT